MSGKSAPSRTETRMLRFGAIAGVLGTLLSIVNGGLTVYSSTVRQAYEDKQRLLHEFEGYVQQISEDDQKITVISGSTEPQQVKIAQAQAANSVKYIAANAAEQLLIKIGDLVSSSQYALLAEAKANMADFKVAREYISRSINLSNGMQRAEALRFQGKVLSSSSDPEDITTILQGYKSAMNIIEKNGNYWGASLAKSGIIHDWIIVETFRGDCMKAIPLVDTYVDTLAHQDVSDDVREFMKKDLYNVIRNQTRCKLPLAKLQ